MRCFSIQGFLSISLLPFLFACSSTNSATRTKAATSITNPEDVLSDQANFNKFQDGNVTVTARKGTIAASAKNAKRLNDPSCVGKERQEIIDWFKEYATTLVVLFQGQIAFTNPEIQKILDDARAKIDAQNSKS